MRSQLIFFMSWIFQLLPGSVPVASESEEVPEYDFWDDSVFDNIRKVKYSRPTSKPDIITDVSVDECVRECEKNISCISLFYHARDRKCEKVVTNLQLHFKLDDPYIEVYPENRYYRYVPARAGNCPLQTCFYYNRVANTCWKVILRRGPRSGTKYNREDAKKGCRNEKSALASIDNQEKFSQLSIRMANLEFVAKLDGSKWQDLYVAGIRLNASTPAMLPSGKQFTPPESWRHPSWDAEVASPYSKCMALKGYGGTDGKYIMHGFTFVPCQTLLEGVVCEKPVGN